MSATKDETNRYHGSLASEIQRLEAELDHSLRHMLRCSDQLHDAIYDLRQQLEGTVHPGKTILLTALNVLNAELRLSSMRMELRDATVETL